MSGQVSIVKYHNSGSPFGLPTSHSIAIKRIRSNLEQVLQEYGMFCDNILDNTSTVVVQKETIDDLPATVPYGAPSRIFSFDEPELNNDTHDVNDDNYDN